MKVEENISLQQLNTFGIRASAKYFARFNTVNELEELLDYGKSPANKFRLPTMILGGGSNILFTKNFDGLVLKNEIKGIELVREDEDHIYIKAGAGEDWHQFVLYCIQHGFAGIENLSLIPGKVGASPMQNIGAYGVEIKDVFHSLEAIKINEKKRYTFHLKDCAFGYRESVFKKQYRNEFIITSVTCRLNKKPVFNISYGAIKQELEKMKINDLSIKAISDAVIKIRSSKLPDPAKIGNAGSFFKNPEVEKDHFEKLLTGFPGISGYPLANGNIKLAAGWLIEKAGWKGFRKGDAGCHTDHALVLVNYGHATGKEIYSLSEEIIQSVKAQYGIELEREVNIV